jgi:hypothetical protein
MNDLDFNFVDDAFKVIAKRKEARGMDQLSEVERTVLLVWWSAGIIGNGGFQYFYENTSDAAEVAKAFDQIGLHEAANACRESMQFFPKQFPPADRDERLALMDGHEAESSRIWERLDCVIWDCHDLPSRLAKLLREGNV